MNHVLSPQEVTDRLVYIESKVATMWLELVDLRQQTKSTAQMSTNHHTMAHFRADKAMYRHWFDSLFTRLSIQGAPMGAETLQEMMHQTALASNELSRAIIEAREE